jgi:acetolactate synthase-1/2/3 large subunit
MPNYQPSYDPDLSQVDRACRLILEARKPVLYVGGGTVLSDANRELTELATKLDIPVTTTLMALGAFPGNHELCMGMLGMHGTYTANMAVAECDLLISVGARFDDRVTGQIETFAPHAKVIHMDIDPTSISKNVKVDVGLISDCRKALTAMNTWFNNEQNISLDQEKGKHREWFNQIKHWSEMHPLSYSDDGDDVIKPQYVVEMLDKHTGGEAIISTEVGQHQMWAAQFYSFSEPRRFLTSGGLGTMGYGFPAAMGAKMAMPDKVVIDIAGDASIQMCIQELATVKQYDCPVKIAILNNQFLGMVRQWQELFYDRRYASTTLDVAPDFVALAEAYGAVGLRATKMSEVEDVIKEALAIDNTVLMDFKISREEGVYPMVPAGKANTDMLLV